MNSELFVNACSSKYNFDIFDSDVKNSGQKSHHEVGGASIDGAGAHADFELIREGFADGGFFCSWGAQDIQNQGRVFPLIKFMSQASAGAHDE